MAEKKRRGFAAMDSEQQRQIASMGGRAAHVRGTAHEWDSLEAAEAGRKGGKAAHRNRASERSDGMAHPVEMMMNPAGAMPDSPGAGAPAGLGNGVPEGRADGRPRAVVPTGDVRRLTEAAGTLTH